MKTISKILKNTTLVVALLIGFTACGQTENNTTSKEVKEVKIKSDFASAHCKARIEEGIGQEKGVKAVNADLSNQIVTIQYQSDKNTAENLAKAVKELGYASNVMSDKNTSTKCPKDGKTCTKADSAKCHKEMMHQGCKMKSTTDTTKACKPSCEKPCCKKK